MTAGVETRHARKTNRINRKEKPMTDPVIRWDDESAPKGEQYCGGCGAMLGGTAGPTVYVNGKPTDRNCVAEMGIWGTEILAALNAFDAEVERLALDGVWTGTQIRGIHDVAKRVAHIGYEPSMGLTKFDVEKAAEFIAMYRANAEERWGSNL